MKFLAAFILLAVATSIQAQAWKVLPKGVRIAGYRNVTTNKITANFNEMGGESPLGAQFRVDMNTLNQMTGGLPIGGTGINPNDFVVGEYKVDAEAQMNVHGMGFGWGLTDRVMFYGEVAYYKANVKAGIKRSAGNTYEDIARQLEQNSGMSQQAIADAIRNLVDVNERSIQSVITNFYGYRPIGNWHGTGYGDMETGLMAKVVDKGIWGLMLYPGVVLPTGYQDDPDILQDVGFGDGQFDLFAEAASGYVVNDKLSFGTTLRYTYQAPTTKKLRIPGDRDFQLSSEKGNFDVKYGDRINWMINSTYAVNDWLSFTPVYRFMYQMESEYSSKHTKANDFLAYNSEKMEHQVQLTTSISSITPFLKKEFLLPATINVNLVKTLSGMNVPSASRFEVEFRMLF